MLLRGFFVLFGCVPEAQTVEYGTNNTKDMGSIPIYELIKYKNLMQCKFLWTKASAKFINAKIQSSVQKKKKDKFNYNFY